MQRPSSTPGRQDVVLRARVPPPPPPPAVPLRPRLPARPPTSSYAPAAPPAQMFGLRRVVALAGIVVVAILGAMIVADPRSEGVEVFQLIVVLPALLLLSSIPFLIYFAEIKSAVVSLITGAVLLGGTTAMYMAVLTSESPATSFVLLASPLVNLLVVGIALTLDFLFQPVD